MNAKKILKTLYEIYAEQEGMNVEIEIKEVRIWTMY